MNPHWDVASAALVALGTFCADPLGCLWPKTEERRAGQLVFDGSR